MHLIPHLTKSMEYDLITASTVFGMMTGTQLVGLFLGGYLGDRFNKRILCVICMIGHFIGLMAVTYATNFWWLIVFVLGHGLGWGIRGPMMVSLRADYFGPRSFGTIMGISSLIVMIGNAVSFSDCFFETGDDNSIINLDGYEILLSLLIETIN